MESLLVLNALGGECLEDLDRLREDAGLAAMVGHPVPSPEAARKFLYQFHEESRVEQAQQELAVGQVSYISEESAALPPYARFGANAAWLGLAVPAHNVLTGVKRAALRDKGAAGAARGAAVSLFLLARQADSPRAA